jgi:ABC-type transport system substrate-binding protein
MWSDGNEFTAEDVVATFNLGRLFKWTIFGYVDEITATDDYTVEFHRASSTARQPPTAIWPTGQRSSSPMAQMKRARNGRRWCRRRPSSALRS